MAAIMLPTGTMEIQDFSCLGRFDDLFFLSFSGCVLVSQRPEVCPACVCKLALCIQILGPYRHCCMLLPLRFCALLWIQVRAEEWSWLFFFFWVLNFNSSNVQCDINFRSIIQRFSHSIHDSVLSTQSVLFNPQEQSCPHSSFSSS